MTNNHSQKKPIQSEEKVEDRTEKAFDEAAAVQEQMPRDVGKPKRALSKREMMDQLSRERFPWDQ
jgi:hypothetical protein